MLFQFKSQQRHQTVAAATLLFIVGTGRAFAEFIPLGSLPGADFHGDAFGISADGMVVVGQSNSASGVEAFRWTEAGGMVGLGFFPGGTGSIAESTSADGSVVVGHGDLRSGILVLLEAFRWTAAGGMVGLGFLPDVNTSAAIDVSDDGRVVVGAAQVGFGFQFSQAFRWTPESGMVSLGTEFSAALAVSADGSVVVGRGRSVPHAVRWTEQGLTDLGTVSPGVGESVAVDVSADGSVIVGVSTAVGGSVPFRWTEATGMVSLELLPGDMDGVAHGVSADGTVIVGESLSVFPRACVWDSINGIRDLRAVLIDQGDDLTGWTLLSARGVSADGRSIVGLGFNPVGQTESWLARLAPVRTPVPIDIKPGSDIDPINPRSSGKIPVAILTTDTFDATTVDAATVRFGSTGTEAAPAKAAVQDVNDDARLDVLFHFNTQDTGIACGETSASLMGETLDMALIGGSDSIKTVGCKK